MAVTNLAIKHWVNKADASVWIACTLLAESLDTLSGLEKVSPLVVTRWIIVWQDGVHTTTARFGSECLSLFFLCSVDRASRYIYVIKSNSMHYLSSVYFLSQPLHVSGIFYKTTHRSLNAYCEILVTRSNFSH
jgi:hypothetical protein